MSTPVGWLPVTNAEAGDVVAVMLRARESGMTHVVNEEERFCIEFTEQWPFLAGCYSEASLRRECARIAPAELSWAS